MAFPCDTLLRRLTTCTNKYCEHYIDSSKVKNSLPTTWKGESRREIQGTRLGRLLLLSDVGDAGMQRHAQLLELLHVTLSHLQHTSKQQQAHAASAQHEACSNSRQWAKNPNNQKASLQKRRQRTSTSKATTHRASSKMLHPPLAAARQSGRRNRTPRR